MQEWIVTLHNREDLPGFYDDMETEGGNLFIPNRAVEVAHKRPISRNTHYMLTREEVDLIKSDDRVWDVTFAEFAEMVKPNGWVMDNEKFSKDWNTD